MTTAAPELGVGGTIGMVLVLVGLVACIVAYHVWVRRREARRADDARDQR
jgi:hypothetical protein